MLHLINHILGLDDPSGAWYLWWSGFGADLPIAAGIAIWMRKHNCHTPRCHRLARHPDTDGKIVCNRHRTRSVIASRA